MKSEIVYNYVESDFAKKVMLGWDKRILPCALALKTLLAQSSFRDTAGKPLEAGILCIGITKNISSEITNLVRKLFRGSIKDFFYFLKPSLETIESQCHLKNIKSNCGTVEKLNKKAASWMPPDQTRTI